ncbi:phosphosulfolactate synthase [Paenibacillus sp. IB182496]|uniref:Phosphosulfolactate synthase n=1 Tax=Paenibacillus sabuli TaxID=2772509 RepID=A0A927BVV5_9BACL|nr:phosphosulfolactate synthase [Paenibacillus sabuli]MBD2847282.1 phosphosulfolactate synthase [Paenibacillus sabuli]
MNEASLQASWPPQLRDPKGMRGQYRQGGRPVQEADRQASGFTMVMDKGLGSHAFGDLLEVAGPYMDCIKLGFGTSVLYDEQLLQEKLAAARRHGILVMPGGTLLEAAVSQQVAGAFFDAVCAAGFSAVEVSDGTIELDRRRRSELIAEGVKRGLRVFTEYGKKSEGSAIEAIELARTVEADIRAGADLVIVEARESGLNIGLFDERGECREGVLEAAAAAVRELGDVLWEAPLKTQQNQLLTRFGPGVHLGNIAPGDCVALEAMRRGLRSDTFVAPVDASANQSSDGYIYVI